MDLPDRSNAVALRYGNVQDDMTVFGVRDRGVTEGREKKEGFAVVSANAHIGEAP